MATKVKKKKGPDILDAPVVKGDWEKLVTQVKANPMLYGACAGFVILCVFVALIYRSTTSTSSRTELTQLARALQNENPGLRETELEPLAKGKDAVSAEAIYLSGESAYEAKQFDKAKEAFDRVRKDFASSPYVADAVEGLGCMAENQGQYQEALGFYNEIIQKWPNSFTRRRQKLNIGRCQERLNGFPEAIAAYQAQAEDFPGSSFETEAKAALDRIKKGHPDLFPKDAEAAKPAEGTTPAAAMAPASDSTAPATPPTPPIPVAPASDTAAPTVPPSGAQ